MVNIPCVDIVTIANKIDQTLFITLNNVSQQSYKEINHIVIYRQASELEVSQLKNFNHQKNLLFSSQQGKGISSAFNNGIEHIKGELVLFLNSGDTLVADNVIEQVVHSHSQNNWLWATGETISISKKGYFKKHRPQYQAWNSKLFWYGNPLCHQSTFYTRSLINKVGLYNESLSIGMDYDYNVRASKIEEPALIRFPIAYYDTTGMSSVRVFKQFRQHRRLRDRYFSLTKFKRFKVDAYCLFKSIFRLMMIPAKLWL